MSKQPITFDDLFMKSGERHVEPRAGQIGETQMRLKSVDEANRQIHFICSTSEVDRYDESIDVNAWKSAIEPFMANPVFPAGHVYVGLSGEPTLIGHWVKLWVEKDGLHGIAQFDDEDELALRYWNLYRKGHMKAVSVGFIAIAWEMRDFEVNGRSRKLRTFTEIELIEISAVAIGANRSALVRAAGAGLGQLGEGENKQVLKRLQTLLEKLESIVDGKQVGPTPHGHDDDATGAAGYLAHFLDEDGDITGDDDTASRSQDEEADTQELNDALRKALAIGA